MKKYITILLIALASLIACHNYDEPDGAELFQDLLECPTDGIYNGIICANSTDDDTGVWCEITRIPEDAASKNAPGLHSFIYFKRDGINESCIKDGMSIRFRILEYKIDSRIHLADVKYYICSIHLIN